MALVKAWKADLHGNLIYRRTARNFNPRQPRAARLPWPKRRLLSSRANSIRMRLTRRGFLFTGWCIIPIRKSALRK